MYRLAVVVPESHPLDSRLSIDSALEPTYSLPIYVTCSLLEHSRLTPGEQRALIALCSLAFDEPFEPYWRSLGSAVHVLLLVGGSIVATACWVERSLQQGDLPPLRTAYVEGVAVEPERQRQGYGATLMSIIAQQVWEYDLCALATGVPDFYARRGWHAWHGPTFVRTADGLLATPDEGVMVRRTGRTPAWLDLNAPLSCEWRDAPDQW